MKYVLIILLSSAWLNASAQQQWSMLQCMQYAVEHNHEVKKSALELDNYKAARTSAEGRFLPQLEGGVGAQYNFGRAIDPETNVYTNVSTFYNSYYVSASLPVFDGFGRLHALKAAKAGELMGRHALRQQQDQAALSVLQAFANAAYYHGMVKMAREKVDEAALLLKQTRTMEEVGRKSAADVAQVESQKAEADYELTRQQNLYASALLELKKEMAYPLADTLQLSLQTDAASIGNHLLPASEKSLNEDNPELKEGEYRIKAGRHEWQQARSALLPKLYLSTGLNTTYYQTLHGQASTTFGSQFRNNLGEYVGATLSIPLFNRLQTITAIRRAKNNYRSAVESHEQKRLELEKLSREAWQDWQGYQKQAIQMERKVEADSLAYQLTRRQYEEGLSTAIDLHSTSSQLLMSKATLLQCQLMAMVKEKLIRYYRGEKIWE